MARDDRRLEIMHAAENLFTSRRYHEITTSDIAQAAKVGKGTIYRYFQNKDDLFFQVATSGFDELCELLHNNVPADLPFSDQLLNACRQISDFFDSRRPLLRMMQAEESRIQWCRKAMKNNFEARRRKLVAAVSSIIVNGLNSGELKSDIPPDVLAGFLLGMLRTRARELAEDYGELPLEMLIHLFIRGAGGAPRDTGEPT